MFSTTYELENIQPTTAALIKNFIPALFYLGAILVVVALARPQCGLGERNVFGEGISIAMCIDRSGSMAALDFMESERRLDRLQAVKKVFKEFVVGSDDFPGRPNDLISLISFGGFIDAKSPLTLDHTSLLELLDSIETPRPVTDAIGRPIRTAVIDEESGTAIGDALATAVDRLKESPTKTKIVVLLSDGAQTTGALSPEQGIKVAKAYGVKVYTIGVGSNGPVPFPIYGRDGEVQGYSMQDLKFDDSTLQTIADATGGEYFFAGDFEGLKRVCETIDRLERARFDGGTYAEYRDYYGIFAALGVALLALEAVLSATRFRTFP
ncbi:MAG: VWA domain-containing protein [Thermoguttaceae bacterium]|nr:VWA domain-containing protein [Thermoguttaceae bacterium]